MKRLLFVDFETYYDKEYSLRRLSPPEYILDPRFKVHLLAVYEQSWPAPRIIQADDIPPFLRSYSPENIVCCSHNALFDLSILSWRYGWIPKGLLDTLAMARSLYTLPKYSLGAVAKHVLGHDPKGDVIHKVIGLDVQGIKNAGLWPSYCTYAMNDVRICAQIFFKMLKIFPPEELRIMDLVLRCAVQPVLHTDIDLLKVHLENLRKTKAQILQECGYDKASLMSTTAFKDILERLGVEVATKLSPTQRMVPAFAKTDPFMSELLEYDKLDEDTNWQVQTLAAARLSHKSTIEETRGERFLNIAKLPWGNGGAMLPVALRYGGAHTHRLSGEWKMNLQNLPRDTSRSKLRACLLAPKGYRLIAADLSQIEARIVACLADQHELIQSFRDGDDVYAQFASRVFNRTITKKLNPNERFIGKTAILGLGYGCGAARFYQMVTSQARQYGIPLEGLFSEDKAEYIVNVYRGLFRRIQNTWKTLDTCLETYLNNRHSDQTRIFGPVVISTAKVTLPNGMTLRYTIPDKDLYGAKLLENITQALARIIIMDAAVRLADMGYRFVLQAHDELVFVVPLHKVEIAKMDIHTEMVRPPAWMPELPLAAEVKVGVNYGDMH